MGSFQRVISNACAGTTRMLDASLSGQRISTCMQDLPIMANVEEKSKPGPERFPSSGPQLAQRRVASSRFLLVDKWSAVCMEQRRYVAD